MIGNLRFYHSGLLFPSMNLESVLTHSQTCADIDVGDADCIEGCPTSSWTSHMVRGTWLSNNHNIFYYGLPSPLLDYLRGARSPAPHAKTIVISMHIS